MTGCLTGKLRQVNQAEVTSGNRAVHLVGVSNPQSVIIPAGVIHAYKNVSSIPGQVFNAPNRLYAGWVLTPIQY